MFFTPCLPFGLCSASRKDFPSSGLHSPTSPCHHFKGSGFPSLLCGKIQQQEIVRKQEGPLALAPSSDHLKQADGASLITTLGIDLNTAPPLAALHY